jgi:hypothetical protein
VGVVYNVLKAHVLRDLDLLKEDSSIVKSILSAPDSPKKYLERYSVSTHKFVEDPEIQLDLSSEIGI